MLQKFDYREEMKGRNDPIRDKVGDYYDCLQDHIKTVMKSDDVYVDFQYSCGIDVHASYQNKITYYISSSFNNYIKFHYDGLLLWEFNEQATKNKINDVIVDENLIHRLQDKLNRGHTKHPLNVSDTCDIPFDSYNLLVLQEFIGTRINDEYTGEGLLIKLCMEANKNKTPLIIRPHPFVPQSATIKNLLRSVQNDYIFVAEAGFHPNRLVKHANSVYGNTSSLLMDAMIQQIPTYTLSGNEYGGGATGDIETQNKWLSWYFNDRCVNTEDANVQDEIRKRLDLAKG